MKSAQQDSAATLLDDLKGLVDSLPLTKRKNLTNALKEAFSELEDAAPRGAEQGARVHAS